MKIKHSVRFIISVFKNTFNGKQGVFAFFLKIIKIKRRNTAQYIQYYDKNGILVYTVMSAKIFTVNRTRTAERKRDAAPSAELIAVSIPGPEVAPILPRKKSDSFALKFRGRAVRAHASLLA